MSDITSNHQYIPRAQQMEDNLFLEEYYSSTDVKIYIDDEEQTEIGYISYSIREQLLPLYGYNSSTYDDVAVGNRIVTGTFKIPIKNPKDNDNIDTIEKHFSNLASVTEYNREEEYRWNNREWINPSGTTTFTKDLKTGQKLKLKEEQMDKTIRKKK